MGFTAVGTPNCALPAMVFQLVYTTLLRALVASTRMSTLTRSVPRKVRPIEAFSANCAGPLMELRPAFPHWPCAGAAKAAGLRKSPEGAS